MEYEIVVGLEVHVHLKTASKMFCSCKNEFGAEANTQVCPVCLGQPGVLPVMNEQAFELAIKSALALNCRIAPLTKFDRKNYYYPDLPKNYQISQYDLPLSHDGHLEIEVNGTTPGGVPPRGNNQKRIGITRVHLEEDAGKLVHPEHTQDGTTPGGVPPRGYSLVDLNRTGVPLMEIVSQPDMNSLEEVHAYLTELKSLLQYLGVSDCDMEKGSLRCEANLSVRPKGQKKLGVKTEIKNLNSFKHVTKALTYETKRQIELLEQGEKILQETLLWNEAKEITSPMRSKEEAQDYRYFPEPDLVPVEISPDWIDRIKQTIPELPKLRKQRFVSEYELPEYDAVVLTQEKALADYFEKCIKLYNQPKSISNWVMGEVLRELKKKKIEIDEFPVKPDRLVELIQIFDKKEITSTAAKDVLAEMIKTNQSAQAIIKTKGLKQISDAGALEGIITQVIKDNPKIVSDYKGGKKTAIGALVGQVMKASHGKANPQIVKTLLTKHLIGKDK